MARVAFRCSVALACVLLAACSAKKNADDKADPAPVEELTATPSKVESDAAAEPEKRPQRQQWYRVVLDAEGGPMPFMFRAPLPRRERNTVVIANAEERIELEMSCAEDDCTVDFPVFASQLRIRFSSNKAFDGHWLRSRYMESTPVPLWALAADGPGGEYRYEAGDPPAVDVTGSWSFDIEGVGPGKGEFVQDEAGLVTGWIIPQNIGDLRYLDGRVDGHTLALSTFDGQHAYNLELELDDSGKRMEGMWHNQVEWHYPMTGRRGEGPSLEALHTLRIKDGGKTVTLPELDALRGKAVIVDLYGTWCPACIDLMPVLVSLYERHRAEGLEILSIALEPGDDEALATQQVELFKKRYGITWPSAIRLDDEIKAGLPPELENVQGFPVTLFVDRKGEVHAMHSGFVSAAAGEEHQRLVKRFEDWTDAILASSP